ncbi:MAG: hypothetical protein C4341_03740 [Armatimonadota bacterium]
MRISELAERASLSVSTIRYYERVGLMLAPHRSDSGYREYTDNDLRRLRFIRSAKAHGLPLKLVKKCLAAVDGSPKPCGEIAALLRDHLERLEEQFKWIEQTKRFVRSQIALWEAGELPSSDCLCAILETGALARQHRRTIMNKSTIDIYAASCGLCDRAKTLVTELAGVCGCKVNVYPADSDRARDAGVVAAPTIVKDGKVLFCGLPTRSALKAALGV